MSESNKKIEMTDSKREVFEELQNIQKELKSPKSNYNDFSNFEYRSAQDILGAVKPFLNKCILLTEYFPEFTQDRCYIKSIVKLTNGIDEINATGYAREPLQKPKMDESQTTGSAFSYARKYALDCLFSLDNSQDPDSMDNRNKQSKQTKSDRQAAQERPVDSFDF